MCVLVNNLDYTVTEKRFKVFIKISKHLKMSSGFLRDRN